MLLTLSHCRVILLSFRDSTRTATTFSGGGFVVVGGVVDGVVGGAVVVLASVVLVTVVVGVVNGVDVCVGVDVGVGVGVESVTPQSRLRKTHSRKWSEVTLKDKGVIVIEVN